MIKKNKLIITGDRNTSILRSEPLGEYFDIFGYGGINIYMMVFLKQE